MLVRDALDALDRLAPPHFAFDGDPHGLLAGDPDAPLTGVAVALDVTLAVVEAAVRDGASLIIAHHPLIYHPLRTIRADAPYPGAVVLAAVRAGVAVACAHTAWDVAPGGINDTLAALLGLTDTCPLQLTSREFGIGRVGTLPAPLTSAQLLERVQAALRFSAVRLVGGNDTPIQTVAVCGGAGASFVPDALAARAQAFVTSDVRHHEFIDAQARGLILLDAGHAATETPGTVILADRLREALPKVNVGFIAW